MDRAKWPRAVKSKWLRCVRVWCQRLSARQRVSVSDLLHPPVSACLRLLFPQSLQAHVKHTVANPPPPLSHPLDDRASVCRWVTLFLSGSRSRSRSLSLSSSPLAQPIYVRPDARTVIVRDATGRISEFSYRAFLGESWRACSHKITPMMSQNHPKDVTKSSPSYCLLHVQEH